MYYQIWSAIPEKWIFTELCIFKIFYLDIFLVLIKSMFLAWVVYEMHAYSIESIMDIFHAYSIESIMEKYSSIVLCFYLLKIKISADMFWMTLLVLWQNPFSLIDILMKLKNKTVKEKKLIKNKTANIFLWAKF